MTVQRLPFSKLNEELWFYLVLGVLAVCFNFPVAIAIAKTKPLRMRKEFLMILGICFVDMFYGCNFISLSIYRFSIKARGLDDVFVSPVDCSRQFTQLFSLFCEQLVSCVVLVNTLDRFLAVFKPVIYYKLSKRSTYFNLAFVFAQSFFLTSMCFIFTQDDLDKEVSIMCFLSQSFDGIVWKILQLIRITSVLISVVLYVPITIELFKLTKTQDSVLRMRLKKLKRPTITVAFSTSTETIFILIPDVIVALDLFGLSKYKVLFYILNVLKSSLNPIVCLIRQPEIFAPIGCFLKRLCHSKSATVANTVTVF